jgi:hypothetical protein
MARTAPAQAKKAGQMAVWVGLAVLDLQKIERKELEARFCVQIADFKKLEVAAPCLCALSINDPQDFELRYRSERQTRSRPNPQSGILAFV